VFSVAAIRYRAVLAADGGPIQSIEEGEISIAGDNYSQANATLRDDLIGRRHLQIYSNADGSGLHSSSMVARYIAISEALERWAYHETLGSFRCRTFGFHIDPSSNGMAAYPGISTAPARRRARFEAIERFCLLNWWERRLEGELRDTPWPGVTAISFSLPIGGIAVILFMRSAWGFFSYGHAAANSYLDACKRARLELARHEWAIRSWILAGKCKPLEDLFERRAWFFSTDEGYVVFRERLKARAETLIPLTEVICDSEILGPWSTYTTVWRYLLRPPSERFLGCDDRYFFW
jgi:hypothetical protein